jgi:hypothetical protein
MLKVTCRLLVTGGFTKLLFFVWLGSQVRSGQVRSGQVRSGQVRSGQVRSGQVRSGQVRSGQVRSGQIKSGQVGSGRVVLGCKVVLAPRNLFIFVGGKIELNKFSST